MFSPTRPNAIIKVFVLFTLLTLAREHHTGSSAEALWFFQDFVPPFLTSNQTAQVAQAIEAAPAQVELQTQQAAAAVSKASESAAAAAANQEFTIGGIRPSSIATLLNTVSETGFHYFNVHDQCRSRTACDVGYMLYKRLNFIHNWIVRTSVRSLVDSNSVYAQSWNNGMMGKNCSLIYPTCQQSPIESFMNFAILAS